GAEHGARSGERHGRLQDVASIHRFSFDHVPPPASGFAGMAAITSDVIRLQQMSSRCDEGGLPVVTYTRRDDEPIAGGRPLRPHARADVGDARLRGRGTELVLAGPRSEVRAIMARTGLDERLGKDRIFATLEIAVTTLTAR